VSIFRAYDIRGIYGKDLTEELAFKIGKALGTFLKGRKTVAVGHDTRPSSPSLTQNIISGLISTGCNVIFLGLVPNPVAYFYAWKKKIFGCYITASHSPVEWNGVKIFKPNGLSFSDKEIKAIEKIVKSEKFIEGKGKVKNEKNPLRDYSKFLKEKIGKVKGKILIDFLGGAGSKVVFLLKDMGLDLIVLHEKPDASLYGFHKFESGEDILKLAIKNVKREDVDFGVALDCDGDRSFFIDPKGNLIDASLMCAIFIEDLLKKNGKIVLTHDCASELEKLVKKKKGKLIWSRIGHNFIEKKVWEEKALFAGEESSHFYFNIFYPFSDGILSALYLCKILNKTGKRLDELVSQFKLNPIKKIYINASTDENKEKIVEKLRKKFSRAIDVGDGIKIKLNKSEWVLIRMSQTLPEINLCAEAMNEKRLEKIVEKYSKIIEKYLNYYRKKGSKWLK